jgi:hypothetical protein
MLKKEIKDKNNNNDKITFYTFKMHNFQKKII